MGKHRNTILYTTLIKGYGMERNLNAALELFYEMRAEEVPYNTIAFNSMLDVCIKCNDISAAEHLMKHVCPQEGGVEDNGFASIDPDLITFSTLIKGYCH